MPLKKMAAGFTVQIIIECTQNLHRKSTVLRYKKKEERMEKKNEQEEKKILPITGCKAR